MHNSKKFHKLQITNAIPNHSKISHFIPHIFQHFEICYLGTNFKLGIRQSRTQSHKIGDKIDKNM